MIRKNASEMRIVLIKSTRSMVDFVVGTAELARDVMRPGLLPVPALPPDPESKMQALRDLIARNRAGSAEALPSVCSAHPQVLAAALLLAESRDAPCLIEATSNQVNQFGGYTAMTPPDFIAHVHGLCDALGVARERVLFGGDHLGPQVWRAQSAEVAMAHARDLVAAYVRAGFTKIHLDCSEGCAGEGAQVGDAIAAARAADLALACEAAAPLPEAVSYVFGTEVPPPGGARAGAEEETVLPTAPEAAQATIAAHAAAFAERGMAETAWRRAVGLVVQPGLEFAPDHVLPFDRAAPDHLSPVLSRHPGLAFEAHSTDYQHPGVYPDLARRHFAVLKVGPALTFAWRQAVYALDAILAWLEPGANRPALSEVMEAEMLTSPGDWQKHYAGDAARLHLLRHFGYADRIRYYWTRPAAQAAVRALMADLARHRPPRPLIEQHFAPAVIDRAETLAPRAATWAEALALSQVQEALSPYYFEPTATS